MKFSRVLNLVALVVWIWLTGVLWSWSGRLVTSASDVGPIAGVLIFVLSLIIWGVVVVKLIGAGIRYYQRSTKNS